MRRASYQNLSGISLRGSRMSAPKHVERVSLKPVHVSQPFVPNVPKPVGRTVLKLKTPLV